MTEMAIPSVPDWLSQRAGAIQPGIRPETRYVLIGGRPMYRLDVRPAAGQFSCAVINAINSRRIDDGKGTFASPEAAFAGGLEELREKLGW